MNNRLENRHHSIILDFNGRVEDERLNVYHLLSESESESMFNYQRIGRYVNSCNGLLFFSDHSDGKVYICNPATNQCKLIPRPPSLEFPRPGFKSNWGCSGLGFDSRSNDYKIIIYVDHLFVDEDHYAGSGYDPPPDESYVELYSLKTDSWKTITDFPTIILTDPCVYADGCIYWLSPLTPYSIDSFDFSDENFSSFSVEDISASLQADSYFAGIVECGGCLGVVAYEMKSPCFELWVKTAGSNSWSKRWDFSLPQLDHHYSAHHLLILGFSENRNGEFLYLVAANNEVFAYDCAANHLEKLQIHLRKYREPVFISYVETTISL